MNVHPHGEKLSAYLDGMLDVAQMRDVAAHLGVCADCRAAHAGLRRTKVLLHEMRAPAAPPPEFWARAYRQMRVGDAARRPHGIPAWDALRDAFRQPQRRWSAGLAAVALLAAAVTGPVFNSRLSLPASSSPAAPAPDSVDVSSLVQAHTESAAHQPLADPDRQDMIAMDDSFTADDNNADTPGGASGTGGDASP